MTQQPAQPVDLDAIETRARAATPGPWHRYPDYGPTFFANTSGAYLRGVGDFDFGVGEQAAADEEFVTHARTDVEAMAAEIRRLRSERDELLRQRDRIAMDTIKAVTSKPEPDIAAADNPTPLRWGLNDVLWGDDDTVTVLLSGPTGEPYWLELGPEAAAVLREDLAGPGGEETHVVADDSSDPEHVDDCPGCATTA
jgi:hypothetical protein